MRSAGIHNLPEWQVISYGNGLAYEIAYKPSGKTLYVQGGVADTFRREFETLTEKSPALDFADALRVIWSDYAGDMQ